MNLRKFYSILICLFIGHEPYVSERWYNWITLKRKGGKRKGKGVKKKHRKRILCRRCGKRLKHL